MIANARRGEITAKLDGKTFRLCLTLGALSELESAFATDDLSSLVERFSSGKLSAKDMIRIIGAGLRAAGHDVANEEVQTMQADGGAAAYARIVAELLTATFGAAEADEALPNP